MRPAQTVARTLPRKSLAQQVADQMRSAIFDGRLRSGATLRQSALARDFGISVIPLREALCQLEGEGLVRHQSHRGVVVADMNVEDVEELIQISTTLEQLAFRRAIPRITDADVSEAEATLKALRTERDLGAFGEQAWSMRRALLQHMQSPRLLQMIENLSKNNRRYLAVFYNDPAARKWLFGQWAKLIQAARRRDLAAVLKNIAKAQREGPVIARRVLPRRESSAEPKS
ncbi:MAG TPA: GntR family transcriptional regulator [Planctomycetota bacterium]|nr:GntR family transcriptional regulator [Planctomycetota bacterium]